jgi:hypothetical protein
VKLTVRALAILMVWLDVAIAPLESVTVTTTVNDPDVVYVCDAGLTVDVLPSPKFQLKLYGDVPPLADAVNVTCCPASGEDGLKEKFTLKGRG